MEDKGKGLSALFGREEPPERPKGCKAALMLMADDGGMYGMVLATEDDLRLLGWLKGREEAELLADLLEAVADGRCEGFHAGDAVDDIAHRLGLG